MHWSAAVLSMHIRNMIIVEVVQVGLPEDCGQSWTGNVAPRPHVADDDPA